MTSLTTQQGQQLLYLNKTHDFRLAQQTHHSNHSKTSKLDALTCVLALWNKATKHSTVRQKWVVPDKIQNNKWAQWHHKHSIIKALRAQHISFNFIQTSELKTMYWQILLIFSKCSALLLVCHHLFTQVAMVVHFDFQSRVGIKMNLTVNTNKQAKRERRRKPIKLSYQSEIRTSKQQ